MAVVLPHHSAYKPKSTGIEIGVQAGTPLFHDFYMDSDDTNPDVFDTPAPVIEYMTTIPAVTFDETALVTKYMAPAPDVTYAAPTPDLTNVPPVAPTTVTEYLAPARVAPSLHPVSNLHDSGLVNPQISTTSMEVSGSLLFAPVSQACQEQIVAGETTLNIVQVTERTQEQIVLERIEEQIVDVPVPPIVEDRVEVAQIIPDPPGPQTVEETSEVVRLQNCS